MLKKMLLFLVTLSLASFAYANQPGNCPPLGTPNVGPPPPWYDYIANGGPSYDGCWSEQLVVFRDASLGGLPPFNGIYETYWDFQSGGTGVLSQTFVVDRSVNQLWFGYQLDFEDPHYDSNDMFFTTVTDQTTGRVLYSDSWFGSYGSYGGDRVPGYIPSTNTYNLNGHTIQVQFSARKNYLYNDVKIFSRGVTLRTHQ